MTQIRTARVVPFVLGIAAAFLGLALYSALRAPPQPLTVRQVNTAIAQAIASVTPPPAYSAQVYRAVQPSLVLIQTGGADESDPEQGGLGSGQGHRDEHGDRQDWKSFRAG